MFFGGTFARCGLIGRLCVGCSLQATKPVAPTPPAAVDKAPPNESAHLPSRDWYHGSASAELDALIAAAASSNLDLEMARARVAQADARARQAHAGILPSVDAGGNANYQEGHFGHGRA